MNKEAREWLGLILLIIFFVIVVETPRNEEARYDVRSSGLDLSL